MVLTMSAESRQPYLREYHIMKALPHANIVAVFDCFNDVVDAARLPQWNAAQEFLAGPVLLVLSQMVPITLHELIRQRVVQRQGVTPYFSRAEFIVVSTSIVDALLHLHKHRVVHRDVNSGTCFLMCCVGCVCVCVLCWVCVVRGVCFVTQLKYYLFARPHLRGNRQLKPSLQIRASR